MAEQEFNILLVEDNPDHIDLIRRAFEYSDSTDLLSVRNSLADALEFINSNPPNLVITDLNLPDGKGTELIELAARGDHGWPIILITSFGNENIAVGAIKAGAIDYMVKSPDAFMTLPDRVSRIKHEWELLTAKTRAQDTLVMKELEQKEILNCMTDAIITFDQDSTVLTFNNAAENLFGYSRNEFVGQSIDLLVPQAFKDQAARLTKDYLKTRETRIIGIGREVEGLHKDQHSFPLHLSVAELPLNDPGKRRFIASCHDLTQLKQQEYLLIQAQKMEAVGELAAGIAHDFNNKLGVIGFTIEAMLTRLGDKEFLTESMNSIQSVVDRSANLIHQLLAFSGRQELNYVSIDLHEIIRDLEKLIFKTIRQDIALTVSIEPDVGYVKIDLTQFQQVMLNLVINAQDAMPNGGVLLIKAHQVELDEAQAKNMSEPMSEPMVPGKYNLITVSDTGIGIKKQDLVHIFEPFFTTKGIGKGTGLGLATAFGIIKQSDGLITVSSDSSADTGDKTAPKTNFCIYLPVYDKSEHAREKVRESLSLVQDRGDNSLILLVEDEKALLKATALILEDAGYRVLKTHSPVEAISIFEKNLNDIDLLFCDVVMPGLNGAELAEKLRKLKPELRVIFTSGYSDDIVEEFGIGDETILQKPIKAQKIQDALKQSLAK